MKYELTEEEGQLLEHYRALLPVFRGQIGELVDALYRVQRCVGKVPEDSAPLRSGDGVEAVKGAGV